LSHTHISQNIRLLTTQTEYGSVLTRSGDGNLYLAGRNVTNTFIQKINLAGDVIWMREFRINPFEPITPIQIFEDTEGMIVGCGTQVQFAGASRGYVFRYDPVLKPVFMGTPHYEQQPPCSRYFRKNARRKFCLLPKSGSC
jgi:hypothetical protein